MQQGHAYQGGPYQGQAFCRRLAQFRQTARSCAALFFLCRSSLDSLDLSRSSSNPCCKKTQWRRPTEGGLTQPTPRCDPSIRSLGDGDRDLRVDECFASCGDDCVLGATTPRIYDRDWDLIVLGLVVRRGRCKEWIGWKELSKVKKAKSRIQGDRSIRSEARREGKTETG